MKKLIIIMALFGTIGMLSVSTAWGMPTPSATGGGWLMNEERSNFGFTVNHGTLGTLTEGGPWYYWPNGRMTYLDDSMALKVKGYEIWRFKVIPSDDGWEIIFGAWVQVDQGSGWSSTGLNPDMTWWARIIAHDYGEPGKMDDFSIALWKPGDWNINTETGFLDAPNEAIYYSVSGMLMGGNINITPP